jgi:hypothetical protein
MTGTIGVPLDNLAGTPVVLQIVAGNPTGVPVVCSAEAPTSARLGIDRTTCHITGTIANTVSGEYSVTILVSDGTQSDRTTFPWRVLSRPQVANQEVTTDKDTPTQITLSASDIDSASLTFSVQSSGHETLGP